MRVAVSVVVLGLACTPALALDLPIQGVFGMDAGDCRAARDENEGGYVAFQKNSTGEGGQGGCDFTAVKQTAPGRYALTGICKPLEGKAKRRTITLIVKNPNAITYDDADYTRCPK